MSCTCIVDQDVDSSEVLDGFRDDILAVLSFGQIGVDVFGFDVGIGGFEMVFDFFDSSLVSESIQNDIESPLGK